MSLGCVYQDSLCDNLSQRTKLNRLNLRDLELKMSIATNYNPGLDVNSVIFEKEGYVLNSTSAVLDALDAGLRRLYLDVYWDRFAKRWHLCPVRPNLQSVNITALASENPSVESNLRSYTGNLDKISKGAPPTGVVLDKKDVTTPFLNKNEPKEKPKSLSADFVQDNGSYADHTMPKGGPGHNQSVICDYRLDFKTFVGALQQYIELSDTNIAASLIYLHLRPKLWDVPTNASRETSLSFMVGQASLNDTLIRLAPRILTPAKVSSYESSEVNHVDSEEQIGNYKAAKPWPNLQKVLYTYRSRLLISFNGTHSRETPGLSQLSSMAFPMEPTVSDPSNKTINELSTLNFTDTFVSDIREWQKAKDAGVSPIISGSRFSIYSDNMFQLLDQHLYFLWAKDQPILYSRKERENFLEGGYSKSIELPACAVITEKGLKVANCNSRFPVLCQRKSDDFDWLITRENYTYFNAKCPDDYVFSTPQSSLESRFLREMISHYPQDWNAWVDFNSLFLPNCWVMGGTSAVCPYNVVEDNRNGIAYISAAGVVAVAAFIFIALFEWDRGKSPMMQTSIRKHKNRSAEYQGIPS